MEKTKLFQANRSRNVLPTLIIEGEDDPTWDNSKIQLLSQNHHGSTVRIIKNASHDPFKDNLIEFTNCLNEFTHTSN